MKTYELGYYQNGTYVVETVQGCTKMQARAKIIQREKRQIKFEEVKEVAES